MNPRGRIDRRRGRREGRMSTSHVLERLADRLRGHPLVIRVAFLRTKIRAYLRHGFILDIFYNMSTGRYSFAVIRGARRIMGWDNAPHHVDVATYPHHFHAIDGSIKPSDLVGNPLVDIEKVLRKLEEFIGV